MKGKCGLIRDDFLEEIFRHQKAETWDEVITGICKLLVFH